jgi:arabinan endo-1,5-alpha-L-arabinosidase
MNKQNMKYWLMGAACFGMLATVTGCKEDEYPDQDIPTMTPKTPTEFSEQVLGPAQLSRVSVHDPSVVWEPSSWSYYIFGSHRAAAKSPNMLTWSTISVPWAADGINNAGNDKAFLTPAVKTVAKGGQQVEMPAFNAHDWSKKGNASWSVDGNMWAPDVIYNKEMKKWCMYLSINGDAWYSSIIMLTSNSILGPYTYQAPVVISGFSGGETYKETDLELAIGTQETLPARYAVGNAWGNRYPNCIDPCVFYDEQGKLWMSYGSWSGGIWMLELDKATGLRNYDVTYALQGSGDDITVDPYFGKKIAGGFYVSGEASYIEYIGGYYYLFMTYGGLAAGGDPDDYNNGGYQMRVFRSQNPDGPFVDSKGIDAVYHSYSLNFGPLANDDRGVNIFGAYGEWGNQAIGGSEERSQGHNSVIAAPDGRAYLVYHTRFQDQGENHAVRVHQLFQNEEGWLVAAPFEYTGEITKSAQIASSQLIAKANIPGKYKILVHEYRLDHTAKALATPQEIELKADGTISGAYNGSWTAKDGTSFVTINIGKEYKGVMIEQTLEPKNDKSPCFTALCSATGVTVWGYKYAELN